MLSIQRCQTIPGLIKSAKTYRLIYKEGKLIVIQMGRAMGPKAKVQSDPLGSAIGNAIANKIGERYEQHIAQVDAQLSQMSFKDLENAVDNKKIFLIDRNNLKSIQVKKTFTGIPKLNIKSSVFKASIHCKKEEEEILNAMVRGMKN